jgi:hypothetical protein
MDMNCNLLSPFHSSELWKQQFGAKSEKFMRTTEEHILQGINPGGIYSAIWCRDAAYILRDWFLLGKIDEVLQQISFIWSHQILPGKEKIIYGRGSPEMEFLSVVASDDIEKTFEGALPTTIYRAGFSEVYAANPDLDSTALMISTTSWILNTVLKAGICKFISLPPTSSSEKNNATSFSIYPSTRSPNQVIEYVVPLMLKAIDYLSSRDVDNDGLLEQNHNEDWMDTVLRAGKIVYSQSCWILALTNLSLLLIELNQQNKGLNKIRNLLNKAIKAVEDKLWSEQDNSYVDLQESHHVGGPFRTLTQDVLLYLVAITENINYDISGSNYNIQRGQICQQQQQHQYQQSPEEQKSEIYTVNIKRALSTLDAIKSRVWKDDWPLVTEAELKSTGPWILKPNYYHNHTFWPWTTGIEILARIRFDQIQECNTLFSKLISKDTHPQLNAYYEWVNPITDKGDGAYPFRTGISAVRVAVSELLYKIREPKNAER